MDAGGIDSWTRHSSCKDWMLKYARRARIRRIKINAKIDDKFHFAPAIIAKFQTVLSKAANSRRGFYERRRLVLHHLRWMREE